MLTPVSLYIYIYIHTYVSIYIYIIYIYIYISLHVSFRLAEGLWHAARRGACGEDLSARNAPKTLNATCSEHELNHSFDIHKPSLTHQNIQYNMHPGHDTNKLSERV